MKSNKQSTSSTTNISALGKRSGQIDPTPPKTPSPFKKCKPAVQLALVQLNQTDVGIVFFRSYNIRMICAKVGKELLTCNSVIIPKLIDPITNLITTTNLFVSAPNGLEGATHDGLRRPFWGLFLRNQSFQEIVRNDANPFVSFERFPNLLLKIGLFLDAFRANGDIEEQVKFNIYFCFILI